MSRERRVQRTPEEKWQIVLEGLKSGNVAETCRKYEIAPNLHTRDRELEFAVPAPTGAATGHLVAFSHQNDLWIRFSPPRMCYLADDENELVSLIRLLTTDQILFKVTKGDERRRVGRDHASNATRRIRVTSRPLCSRRLLVVQVRHLTVASYTN